MFYEYKCTNCDTIFDVQQGMHEEHVADCPQCGRRAKRLYAVPDFKIDWVNGGWHGDDLNLGLGKHFRSARERDSYAAERGLVKSPEL